MTLRAGPYGPYVQLGDAEGKEKPRRHSSALSRRLDAAIVDASREYVA